MPFDDFAAFVDQEGGFFVSDRTATAEPSARTTPAGALRRQQSRLGRGMKHSPNGINNNRLPNRRQIRTISGRPYIVRNFRDGRSNKKGVM